MGSAGENFKMNFPEQTDGTKRISINSLSDDCLAKLFMYLPIIDRLNIEHVCKRWDAVSEFSWYGVKKLDCSEFSLQSTVELILHRCGFYLTHLTLTEYLSSSIIKIVSDSCSNLIEINIKIKNLNVNDFIDAFTPMKKLKNFSLEIREMLDEANQIGVLDSLPETMEKIELTNLESSLKLSASFFTSFEKFTSLQSLKLENLLLSSSALSATGQLIKSTLTEISQLTSLINLNLSSCGSIEFPPFSSLINLEFLKLKSITSTNLPNDLVNSCEKLKSLTITVCPTVTSESLHGISRLKNIETLNITRQTNLNDNFFNYFEKLKVLDCSGCPVVGDVGIMKVLKNCKTLESLNVTNTDVTIETIFYAVEVTKSRFNNIILTLTVDKRIFRKFRSDEREDKISPFLQILEHFDENEWENDLGEPDDVNGGDWWDGVVDDDDDEDARSVDTWNNSASADEFDEGDVDYPENEDYIFEEAGNGEEDDGVDEENYELSEDNGDEIDEEALDQGEIDEGAWDDGENDEEIDEGAWDDGENDEEIDEGALNEEEIDEGAWDDGENDEEIDEGAWDDDSPDFLDLLDPPEQEDEVDFDPDFDDQPDETDFFDLNENYGEDCCCDFDDIQENFDENQDDDFGW